MSRPIPYTSVIIDPMNCPQVEHWANDLQVQTYELRAAIKLVGPRLSDLRRYFGKSAHIIFLDNRRNKIQATASPYGLPA
jgi:Protein of unknown function (DUF3606)